MNIRYLILVTLWFFISGVPARALDPNQPAGSLLRTHFTPDEGLPGAVVDDIEQTRDGFLWLITNTNNLSRFDGKHFYNLTKPRPVTLTVAPNGDFWAGSIAGLIHVPAANFGRFTLTGLTTYQPGPGKASQVLCVRFSRSGVLWVGTADGLFRYDGDQFVAVGPRVLTHRIQEAPDGHLLVMNTEGFMELAGSEVVPHPQLAAQLGVKENEIFDVLKDSRGNTWYCTGSGVARETGGQISKLGFYGPGHSATRAYEDAQGNVWIGKEEGLFRATPSGLELVAAGMKVRSLYSDRDGNLWVGTNGDGLYRFKDRAVRMFTTDDGLPNNLLMTVVATHDGAVWTGANCGGITRFDGTHFQSFNEKHGLLNTCVYTIAEDLNRDLWIGTWGGGAYRYHDGKFTEYKTNQGMADDRVTSIIAARDGSVWFGTRGGLTRLKNGQFRTFTTDDGLSTNSIMKVLEDRAGNIWIGTRFGLQRLVGDRFEDFASLPRVFTVPVGEDRDGGFFVLMDVDGEPVTHRLNKTRADPIKYIAGNGMVETERGELWFGGAGAFSRLHPGNFTHSRAPDEPLDFEVFSMEDGLNTYEAVGPDRTVALTRDGKVWAATAKGLAMFDLSRLPVTGTKPSIYLTDVTIGRNIQRADGEIVVPPGTSHVRIDFAAVELSAPEKIRMQYRLEGVDSEWLDATNSFAIYTNIPVGTHALQIRACNRNGIWDRQGVAFSITQQPFFYQTRWFIAAMVALGFLLVFLLYNLRVAQISRMLSARFDERLAERTRVARELHDTLLQTVQGSKIVADHALKNSADHTRMVRAMEQLATWLTQATEEGRAALHSLRGSTTEKNNLAEAFRRAIDECGIANKAEISLSVNGNPTEMHPVVRDEIYRIGYEAIRNACAHSGANRLEITLDYAHDLTLRISDNGTGIDADVVEQGKDGHFGLRGMRERAKRIDSKFTIASSPDSGTVITLVVPGRVALHTGNSQLFNPEFQN